MKDIELAISELLDTYRNKSDKGGAVAALRTQADLTARDDSWTKSAEGQPEPEAPAREIPPGATRADEKGVPPAEPAAATTEDPTSEDAPKKKK